MMPDAVLADKQANGHGRSVPKKQQLKKLKTPEINKRNGGVVVSRKVSNCARQNSHFDWSGSGRPFLENLLPSKYCRSGAWSPEMGSVALSRRHHPVRKSDKTKAQS
jgi:hypothetical protein